MAQRFIVAATPKEALPRLREIWDGGMAFTLDLLDEVAVSEVEALEYQRRYLELFDELGPEMAKWLVHDARREENFSRLSISVKLSSLFSQMDPVNCGGSIEMAKDRLRPISRSITGSRTSPSPFSRACWRKRSAGGRRSPSLSN